MARGRRRVLLAPGPGDGRRTTAGGHRPRRGATGWDTWRVWRSNAGVGWGAGWGRVGVSTMICSTEGVPWTTGHAWCFRVRPRFDRLCGGTRPWSPTSGSCGGGRIFTTPEALVFEQLNVSQNVSKNPSWMFEQRRSMCFFCLDFWRLTDLVTEASNEKRDRQRGTEGYE